jgi:hypothetical protein
MQSTFHATTQEMILGKQLSLKLGKSAGIDVYIANYIQKRDKQAMVSVLRILFNKISITNIIPHDWETALLIPVFMNKESNTDGSNCRPIAIACIRRSVFEMSTLTELDDLVQLLCDNQGGFGKSRSRLHHILC